ncbi:MAG TPA: hypothetical protein VGM39_05970 [Kofleriaceae bacterium]|jgi:uncharacterized membrane protein YebE (DUF533 family)
MPARVLPADLAELYAQAMLAITRADHHVSDEEGHQLQAKIDERSDRQIDFADLLLADPLQPAALAALVDGAQSPFRASGLHAGELAQILVSDAVEVLLAKGYIADSEAGAVYRFAMALGCTREQVRAMSRFLPAFV